MWQQKQLLTFSIWDWVSATNLTYHLLQIQKVFFVLFCFLIKTAVYLDRWLSYCDCLIVQQWVLLLLSRLGWQVEEDVEAAVGSQRRVLTAGTTPVWKITRTTSGVSLVWLVGGGIIKKVSRFSLKTGVSASQQPWRPHTHRGEEPPADSEGQKIEPATFRWDRHLLLCRSETPPRARNLQDGGKKRWAKKTQQQQKAFVFHKSKTAGLPEERQREVL